MSLWKERLRSSLLYSSFNICKVDFVKFSWSWNQLLIESEARSAESLEARSSESRTDVAPNARRRMRISVRGFLYIYLYIYFGVCTDRLIGYVTRLWRARHSKAKEDYSGLTWSTLTELQLFVCFSTREKRMVVAKNPLPSLRELLRISYF